MAHSLKEFLPLLKCLYLQQNYLLCHILHCQPVRLILHLHIIQEIPRPSNQTYIANENIFIKAVVCLMTQSTIIFFNVFISFWNIKISCSKSNVMSVSIWRNLSNFFWKIISSFK